MATKLALDVELKEIIEELCWDYDTSPRSYSGRGMYGDECLGFTVDQPMEFLMKLGLELAQIDVDVVEQMASSVSTDSMGLSSIVYFPGIEPWETDVDD